MSLIFLLTYASASAANVREHNYGGMVRSAAAITQQICAVLVFFVRLSVLLLSTERSIGGWWLTLVLNAVLFVVCCTWQSVFEFVRQDAISAAVLGGIDVFLAVAGFGVLRIHLGLPLRACVVLADGCGGSSN
jgi:hypothetical protein